MITQDTWADYHERARDRAKAEAKGDGETDRFLKTWERGHELYEGRKMLKFAVASRSSGGMHEVHVEELDAVSVEIRRCDCKGFQYGRTCTHTAAVERRLERDGRLVLEPTFFDPQQPEDIEAPAEIGAF